MFPLQRFAPSVDKFWKVIALKLQSKYEYVMLYHLLVTFPHAEDLEMLISQLQGPPGPPGIGLPGKTGPTGHQGIPGKQCINFCGHVRLTKFGDFQVILALLDCRASVELWD